MQSPREAQEMAAKSLSAFATLGEGTIVQPLSDPDSTRVLMSLLDDWALPAAMQWLAPGQDSPAKPSLDVSVGSALGTTTHLPFSSRSTSVETVRLFEPFTKESPPAVQTVSEVQSTDCSVACALSYCAR